MAKVYHLQKINKALLKKEIEQSFKDCNRIAIKMHFGEPGNQTALKPIDLKPLAEVLHETGIEFFMFDSTVAYDSIRKDVKKHKEWALKKGWGKLGEVIVEEEFIKAKGQSMQYDVCKRLAEADGVLIVSHFKGHLCSGFGGAIKNLGMGALSKKSKNSIHEGGKPIYKGGCIRCKSCEKACPLGSLKVNESPVFSLCFGCSNCSYACPQGAIKPKIGLFDNLLAEGANAAYSSFKKSYCITFLKNITKECDCEAEPGEIIAEDNGVLLSSDVVAIDHAAHSIITGKAKQDVFLRFNKKTGLQQVEAAEKLNMGSTAYKILKA